MISMIILLYNLMMIIIIQYIVLLDDCHSIVQLDDDQDEEKFQREILSDEPNLIKLYLQVANGIQISYIPMPNAKFWFWMILEDYYKKG